MSVRTYVRVWTLLSTSLYGLYLRNHSTDLIFLLHMERTYIGAVQRRVNFDFFQKLRKWEFFEKMYNFLNGLKIFMSLYGLYIRNPSTDLIFLLRMERTYIGAVQSRVIFWFFWKIDEMRILWKNVKILKWT